ncbi:hypothetical protein [Vulcanisaeta sp. JCM 14467]|uniref:hypothetical protein n=1 Tax=Vulcanisaeta sp. JCM 14467 TaxID=1295370 RepID=UPI002093D130|nr:hypothetical protein [Vulcanisaeta sp. JCM 14467]
MHREGNDTGTVGQATVSLYGNPKPSTQSTAVPATQLINNLNPDETKLIGTAGRLLTTLINGGGCEEFTAAGSARPRTR